MWLPLLVIAAVIFLYRWHRQNKILQNLTDKYVLITGCDTGFGNLLAKQLDQRRLRVLAACLTQNGCEELKKEASSRLQTLILDVSDSQSVNSATKWVTNTVGNKGLWGLVNNAGAGFPNGPNEWQKKDDFARLLDVNVLGLVDVTLKMLPLIRQTQGRIVNVSSCVGRLAVLGGGYCPSKFAVQAFSDSLRRELCDFGVKVSIVEPGAFQTPLTSLDRHLNNLKNLWENVPAEIKESYGDQYYQTYISIVVKSFQSVNPKLHEVTDCMEHALTAVHPWTRYSVGWDCKLFYIPLSYLPTVLSDYVLCHSAPKPAHRVN
ncbi:retinol dehydrogenase 7-like [Pelodytes ibericus]